MLDWNPALYRRFEGERTRPAAELLARASVAQPAVSTRALQVVDLGCGPGNSTELLVNRFPGAAVTGVDNSEAMLVAARQRLPHTSFVCADLVKLDAWLPSTAPDVIFANASLQWVGGHDTLIKQLFAALAPGGVLAIQMPDNRHEASHVLMREVAQESPFREVLAAARPAGQTAEPRTRIASLGQYYDWLVPHAAAVDVWHTIYQHPMASAADIVQWLRGTGLKPFVEALPQELQGDYLAEYERRIDTAYPAHSDGKRLLAFPRLFIVAHKKP